MMATMAAPRKSLSIQDYPEHLNPFYEDDNHSKIRFWTLGKKLNRSNSINFSGIKDLKNSWALRSFMKKGKKGQSSQEKPKNNVNGETSPIMYRRAMQYSSGTGVRSTVGSPERYVYGGSVTPLPRSRFQERLRSPSNYEVNSPSATPRLARSEVSGSRASLQSTNPFDEAPVPPVRASRRKKKRAPPPPAATTPPDDETTKSNETSHTQTTKVDEVLQTSADKDLEVDEMNLNIELKIVEDDDILPNAAENTAITEESVDLNQNNNRLDIVSLENNKKDIDAIPSSIETRVINSKVNSEEDVLHSASFSKIDIVKYRRNSSVNEDDIRLRRGNLEDFHSLATKRSKSLTSALDSSYATYDINLNENLAALDSNGNKEPQKVVCKVYDETARKQSIETISSTEKEFIEIDRATRELEREISKLNSALKEEEIPSSEHRLSVSEIKRKFDQSAASAPNPIPKPRRSFYNGSP